MTEVTVITTKLERQILDALDTAMGCLMLVAQDRKPIDLDECRAEIQAAYDALVGATAPPSEGGQE